MKSDLNRLMERENFDALWVIGAAFHNPAMTYFTGNAHVSQADLVLPREGEPVLFCDSMEREEAAKTGFKTIVKAKYEFQKVLEECAGNVQQANARVHREMFKELGINTGRIAVYGKEEVGLVYGLIKELEKLMPGIEFVGEGSNSILLESRSTKDQDEIERIREMGRITIEVVAKTADLLQNSQVNEDEVLLNSDSKPLTIGQVKNKIDLWLAERGAENPEGTIFAIGRDAGIPHNAGNPDDPITLGRTIIFDIFPRESGGGYFFDFTRTWCLGYASEDQQKLFNDVQSVYKTIMTELKVDQKAAYYQDQTCELFEELGHPTIRQDSQLKSGYVHSLGHGLGLDVHERPWFSKRGEEADLLEAGTVVTIEPGLYYPEKGMGCRLEDTVWVRPDGKMEILAEYPYQLVLPIKGWKQK